MAFYALCMSSIFPLVTSNITKAVGSDRQGEISGWTTNLQSISQTTSPLISTGFLEIGGLTIGTIFFSPYHLIGFTNVILALILLTVAYIDVKMHPNLYSYEMMGGGIEKPEFLREFDQ